MGLFEIVMTLAGITYDLSKDAIDYVKSKASFEDILGGLIKDSFEVQLPRLKHFCKDGTPTFENKLFNDKVSNLKFNATKSEDLTAELLPIVTICISMPGASCGVEEYQEIFIAIIENALNGFFRKISNYTQLSNEILLEQSATTNNKLTGLQSEVEKILELIKELSKQTNIIWMKSFDKLDDQAPPKEQKVGSKIFQNPFNLSRSEDFNHNYQKIAELFQNIPEWENITSRTENIFIEGGRGTGKSMLLRRLTVQTSVAAAKVKETIKNFEEMNLDYYGVYVKLTRGYYDQFESDEKLDPKIASLLAQHELNLEIFEAFVDSLIWMVKEQVLPNLNDDQTIIINELNKLFPHAPRVSTLRDLSYIVFRFEQDQILKYCRDVMFNNDVKYEGSAVETSSFIRNLSQIFRKIIFPTKQIRLFLLLDEFESLTFGQQKSINTIIKMRLPDITLKIAVRRGGRKTTETNTPEDPIQIPRDYTEIFLDYDINSKHYQDLLLGIAKKRLEAGGYSKTDLGDFIFLEENFIEVSEEEIERELNPNFSIDKKRRSVSSIKSIT